MEVNNQSLETSTVPFVSEPYLTTMEGLWSKLRTLPGPLSSNVLWDTFENQDGEEKQKEEDSPSMFQSRMLDEDINEFELRKRKKPIPWLNSKEARRNRKRKTKKPLVSEDSQLYKLWSDMSYQNFQNHHLFEETESESKSHSASIPSQIFAPPSSLDLHENQDVSSPTQDSKTEIVIKVMPIIHQIPAPSQIEPYQSPVADRRFYDIYEDDELDEIDRVDDLDYDEGNEVYVIEERSDSGGHHASYSTTSYEPDNSLLYLLIPLLLVLGLALGALLSAISSSGTSSTTSGGSSSFSINTTNIINITGPNIVNNITNINNNNASNVNNDNDNITNINMGRSFDMNWTGRGSAFEHLMYFLGLADDRYFVPYYIQSAKEIRANEVWLQLSTLSRKSSCLAHLDPPVNRSCVLRVFCDHFSDDILTYDNNMLIRIAEIFWTGILGHFEPLRSGNETQMEMLDHATQIINIASRDQCSEVFECPNLVHIDCYYIY